MALTWQQRLDAASTEAEIVGITQDYVATLKGDIIERLPAELRPGRFSNATEVASYAFSMVLHRLQDTSDVADQVQTIASFFTSAAARLTQVTARARPNPE